MKYQNKPEIVEAEQFTGDNNPFGVVRESNIWDGTKSVVTGYYIFTGEGSLSLTVRESYWIIKLSDDDYDLLSDKDFKEQYDPVVEPEEYEPYMGWCDVEGCNNEASIGGCEWRETGYWKICHKHSKREIAVQPQMKQKSIEREKSRLPDGTLPFNPLA